MNAKLQRQPTWLEDSRNARGGGIPLMLAWAFSLSLITNSAVQAAGVSLERVEYSALPASQTYLDLSFSGPPPKPAAFATDSPARIAIDLPGVKNGLKRNQVPIGVGFAHSLIAVEASDRTRVVVNLTDSVPYDVQTRGNQMRVIVNPPAKNAAPQTAHSTGKSAPVTGSVPATRQRAEGTHVENIDFRLGAAGEGRILITLPSDKTRVDVQEQGTHILLSIMDARLPARLVRRLDVTDFASPVVTVDAVPRKDHVKIDIATQGEYEYLAYQADRLYTVEIRHLTKEEKEQLQRERLVYSGDRLSLNFQDIEVRAVLQLLADFTGLNLVASDTVKGSITLRLKNVPWDQALDIILKTKGLSMRRHDNVIMVAPTEEIALQEKLELESQRQIEELAPLQSEFIQVNYAKATVLASLLKSPDNRLLSERGNVSMDERTNTLLVQETAAKLEEIRRLVHKLDRPVRQVMIESRVVIANNDFARDLGVRFGFSRSNDIGDSEINISGSRPGYISNTYSADKGPFLADPQGNPFNSGLNVDDGSIPTIGAEALMVNLPANFVTSGTQGAAINFLIGKVGSYLLQLELSAMQQEGRGEIISSPRVITSDKHQATIKQGVEIPYQESSSSGRTTIAFKEAVLQLDVTPHITPDDRIIMDLAINKDNPDYTREILGVPPVDTRAVRTSVLVDNGETVVLGGVYEREKRQQKDQVPFLGDLPLLGVLFKRNFSQDNNKELLIFVTPKILKENLSVR